MLNSADYGFPPSYSYDLQGEQPCYDMSKNEQSGPSHMQALQPTAMSVRVRKISIIIKNIDKQSFSRLSRLEFVEHIFFEIIKQNNSLNPQLRGS